MPQDFAKRRGAQPKNRRNSPDRRTRTTKVTPRRYFHGPSFSGGVVLGAIVVIGTAYLPELLPSLLQRGAALANNTSVGTTNTVASSEPAAAVIERPKLRFEFDEMLKRDVVRADPERYYDPEAQHDAPASKEILLQAASFRTQAEANELRAELLLMDLPAATSPVELASGRWIRVTVGPFASQVLAQRAMTALRKQSIAPLWIERNAT